MQQVQRDPLHRAAWVYHLDKFITPTAGAHPYLAGTVVDLSASPAGGGQFSGWTGDLTGVVNPTQVLLDAHKAITATFTGVTYVITPIAGAGGSITPNTPQTVAYGGSRTFTIAPTTGYHIADVYVDGVSQGVLSSHAFTNVTANHTLTAAFALSGTCMPVNGVGFILTPLRPQIGETVWFMGMLVGGSAPLTYTWTWGDGTAAGTSAILSHVFPLTAAVRAYTVTLNVSNQCSGPLNAAQTIAVMPRQIFLPLILHSHNQ